MNSTQPSQKYSVTLQRFSPIFLNCSKPQLETKKTDAMVREQRPIASFFFLGDNYLFFINFIGV